MNWKFWSKEDKNPQDWNPHWAIKALYTTWRIVFAGFKIALGAAATVLLVGVVCMFVFATTLGDYLEEDILPNAGMDIEDSDLDMTSKVWYLDEDGQIQLLQKIYAEANREWATYDQIPEDLIHAAVAIEDRRFYEHQGVDWFTTIKACTRMFFGDSSVGGSSITQQLVKNVLLLEGDDSANDVTVQRKVIEIFRAIQMERQYSKEQIMEEYLNTIYMGQMCYGVRSAAEAYFGKELEMLTLAECASLISITNNPSLFDPYGEEFMYQGKMMTGMERNRSRQELVLEQMLEQGWITQEEFDEAWNQELVLKNGISLEDTLATCPNESCGYQNIVGTLVQEGDKYYCPQCNTEIQVDKDSSEEVYSWFVDTLLEDVAKALAEQDGVVWNDNTQKLYMQQIRRGGYNIYATIDMEVQNQIDAIYEDLTQIPDTRSGQQLQSAIVIIDNSTGNIVGLAGGVGDDKGFDDFNRATDAKLQSGSSIKPLSIYAPAFELGTITPATVVKDLPLNYDSGAWPLNDVRRYDYARTIYNGVVSSVNAIAANTLDMIGTTYSYQFAKEKFHLSSLVDSYTDSAGVVHSDQDFAPLAMGAQTFGVKVRDMASAFATFANNGEYREGRTFTKVYDSNGKLVLDNTQESEQILSEKTVNYMNYCLSWATSSGTGYEAKISGMSTAGKTGTTADDKDRWYCGFTNYYTAAVWCGYDSPEDIYVTSSGVHNPSAYLFNRVMTPLHEGKEDVSLYDSSKMVSVSVCIYSGKLATDACRNDIRNGLNGESFSCVQSALVYPEDIPNGYCDKHTNVEYCSGGGVATEYCHLFAEEDASIKFRESALVKMTQGELDEIAKAKSYNLLDIYEQDVFVYLVNENGSDGVFKGIYGNLDQDVDAPYIVCPVHTKEAWEKYQQSQKPTDPTDPTEPTTPGVTDGLFPWLDW